MSDFLTGRSLDSYYRALAPRPDAEYGSILPFAYNAPGSPTWVQEGRDFRPALPEFARSAMKGVLDLLQGTETGKLTPEALETITLGSLGAGAMLAPRGALASGAARLEMDQASRLARARSLGFNVDRPLYHGTLAPDFPAFGTVPPWEAVRRGRPPGIWTAENPAVASRLSEAEVRSRLGLSPTSPTPGLLLDQAHSRILPLLARSERTAELTLPPRPDWGEVWNKIGGRFYEGYDSVRLQNYTMFPELGPQTIWAFRDPAQLRSRFAAFDPAKRDSSDLMAGFAAPGPAPVPGLDAWRPPVPEPPGMIRLPTGQVVDEAAIPNHLRSSERQVY